MKKKIAILGSTGSIGKSTLDVVRKNKKFFDVVFLSANSNYKKLIQQAKEFNVKNVLIKNIKFYEITKKNLKKNKYKDYLTYLFAYLFLLLFIFYSIKDTLAAIEKTADKQYQSQKLLNIVLKQCNVLKEIEECKFSKKKFYKVQNNLIIFYDTDGLHSSSSLSSILVI